MMHPSLLAGALVLLLASAGSAQARPGTASETAAVAALYDSPPECSALVVSDRDPTYARIDFVPSASCEPTSNGFGIARRTSTGRYVDVYQASDGSDACALTPLPPAVGEELRACSASAWYPCSKASGNAAARKAGLRSALDRDRVLRRVFSGTQPSRVYRAPSVSYCGDFDRDGRLDRALHYQCCTVSSPAPWIVLRRMGGRWRIVYKRLSDTTFRLEPLGATLVTTEPRYSRTDSNCCPSRLRIGTLSWTGSRFSRFFIVQDAEKE